MKAPSSLRLKFFTDRSTAFKASPADESAQAEHQAVKLVEDSDIPMQHVRTDLTKSDHAEPSSATCVVSGGHTLKNAETFNPALDPVADVLGISPSCGTPTPVR